MVDKGELLRTVKSYTIGPTFEADVAANEICMTDHVIETALPALREGGLLEDRLSVVSFDKAFATFIILPKPWRKSKAPKFEEEFLKQSFPEININYRYRTSETELFRFKVFLHYEREALLYQAVASFDRNTYILGDFPGKPLVKRR